MTHYRFVSIRLTLIVIFFIVFSLLSLPYMGYVFLKSPLNFPVYLQMPLLSAFGNGILLCIATCIFTLIWSVPSAIFLALYPIRFKKIWLSLCILPIAIPSYLSAYVYSDLLYFSGSVSQWYHGLTGQFLPFNIHSLIGASFVLSLSLYPYIFLPLYVRFQQFPQHIFEYARTIGHKKIYVIYHALFKSAIPVILFGLSLITLEALSDYGTVSHFGVRVPSLFLFEIWQQTGNISIAMNITFIFLLLTGSIFTSAYLYQQKKNYDDAQSHKKTSYFQIKKPLYQYLIYLWLFVVLFISLCLPIGFFLYHFFTMPFPEIDFIQNLANNSFIPAIIASILCTIIGFIFSYYHYHSHNKVLKSAIIVATSGYAFPSVILGIAVYSVLLTMNRYVNYAFDMQISIISGSIFGLVICYYMKFVTVTYGCLNPVFKTINPSLFQSAITMGHSPIKASRNIYWPFFKKPILVGFVLVLVDILKELPITLLMRPFGFESFATYCYNMASLERIDEAAIAALILIFMGIFAALFPITSHITKQ